MKRHLMSLWVRLLFAVVILTASLGPLVASASTVPPALPPSSVTPPAGLGWDYGAWPFDVASVSGKASVRVNVRSWVSPTIWTAPRATCHFHVDPVNGSDTTGTGLGTYDGDWSAAVKSAGKALQLGNADANCPDAYQVLLRNNNYYTRSNSFSGLAGTIVPTKHLGVSCLGGTNCNMGTFDDITWAVDGTYGNLSSATLSNALKVVDRIHPVSFTGPTGLSITRMPEFTLSADPATCNAVSATTYCWVLAGGKIYVHRGDGVAPTNANTRVYRDAAGFRLDGTSKDVYVQGVDFEGGAAGAIAAQVAATTRNLVFVNGSAGYAGGVGRAANSVAIDYNVGVAAFVDWKATSSWVDGLNIHKTDGGSPSYMFCLRCISWWTGGAGQTSANAFTGHENTVSAILASDGSWGHGGTCRYINFSRVWFWRTACHDDQGDGSIKGEFMAGDNTWMWLDETTAAGTGISVNPGSGTIIYKRNHRTLSGTESGGGTATSFTN